MAWKLTLALAVVGVALSLSSTPDRSSAAPLACAPGYSPCLPVKSDIDCGDIPDAKTPVRVTGSDAYGLDADKDGLGCEVGGGGAQSPWGLILRKPPKKEAISAKMGDTLTVVGWSPASAEGSKYELCASRGAKQTCISGKGTLAPRVQTFGLWKVKAGESSGNVFKMTLRVQGKNRASDTVPLR